MKLLSEVCPGPRNNPLHFGADPDLTAEIGWLTFFLFHGKQTIFIYVVMRIATLVLKGLSQLGI